MVLGLYDLYPFESTLRFSKTFACRQGQTCYRARLVTGPMRGEVINVEDTELVVARFGND
jgi:hypothetical protein